MSHRDTCRGGLARRSDGTFGRPASQTQKIANCVCETFCEYFARNTRRLSLPTAGLTGHTNTCTRHTVSVTDVMHAISRGLPQCAQTLRPGTCPAPGFASRVRRYARSYLVLARHDSDFTIHPSLSVPSSQPLRRDGAPSRRSFFWIAAVARCSMLTTGGRSGRRVGPHRRGALL